MVSAIAPCVADMTEWASGPPVACVVAALFVEADGMFS